MSKVIMISRDSKVLDKDSSVYSRVLEYGNIFDELHVVVMAKSAGKTTAVNAKNVFFYDTTSKHKTASFIRVLGRAVKIAKKIGKGNWVTAQDFESGLAALLVSKMYGLKFQLQLHTDVFSHFYPRLGAFNYVRYLLARFLIPTANSLRVVSQKIKSEILEKKLLPEGNIFVLPVLVDTNAFWASASTYDLHGKYPEFEKIVLIVARLTKEKNLDLSFEAFQKILRVLPKAGLVVLGDGREKNKLKRLAKHLDILSSIRFEGWVKDTASAYRSADLLLVTSFYEGFGMNIIEALSVGCPVVSTDVGIAGEAGAEVCNYDAGEIALKSVGILEEGIKGKLLPEFSGVTKETYLRQFKETFV